MTHLETIEVFNGNGAAYAYQTIGDENDSNSILGTSTICKACEPSMHLSLPDSFDDSFSDLHGLIPNYPSHAHAEVRLLQAQLFDAQQQINELTLEREANLQSRGDATCMSEEDIQVIKSLPQR